MAIDVKSVDMPDNVEGEVGDSSTPTTQQTSVIEVAVDKRVTRTATYYKVFYTDFGTQVKPCMSIMILCGTYLCTLHR